MPELGKQLNLPANPTRSSAQAWGRCQSAEHEIAPLHCKAESGEPKLPSSLSKAALSGLKHGTLATSPLMRLITNFQPCILYSNFSFRHFFQILLKKIKDDLGFWAGFIWTRVLYTTTWTWNISRQCNVYMFLYCVPLLLFSLQLGFVHNAT